MKVVITGGTGFIGRRLAQRLLQRNAVIGPAGKETAIDELVLFDVASPQPPLPQDKRLRVVTGDIADAAAIRRLIDKETGAVFHLAAIVSGQAEADTDLGYRVNLDGTRALLEAIRAVGDGYRPRLVYTSSIAVFGAPFPPTIPDDFHLTPLTSYGTQKAMCELLLADYTRRGFLDGVGIRLPSIVVRPGKPNKAASGFFSGIIREPLAGQEAVLPVEESVLHWHARRAGGIV